MSEGEGDKFRERSQHMIQEAWEINGGPGIEDDIEVQLRILNGLLAMALTEVAAKPFTGGKFGSLVSLRDLFEGSDG